MLHWLLAPWRFALLHLRRTFAYNLRTLPLSDWEKRRLTARGVEDETTQQFLAWRRSTLLFAALAMTYSASAHSAVALGSYLELPWIWSDLGLMLQTIRHTVLFALPLTAFAAFALWARPRVTHRLVLVGWGLSVLVPLLLSFVPPSRLLTLDRLQPAQQLQLLEELGNLFEFPVTIHVGVDRLRQGLYQFIDIVGGAVYAFYLLPTILSLIPGVFRACARIKALLPGSSLPGWSLVTTAPVYTFGFLVFLVLLHQVVGSWLLLTSTVLFATAPLVYLLRAPLLLRPGAGESTSRALRSLQLVNSVMTTLAILLLCGYLNRLTFRWEGETKSLLGLFPETSWMQPWDLLQFCVEYLGRASFVTILVADVVLRMHCLEWAESRPFADTPGHREYEETMGGLARHLGRR